MKFDKNAWVWPNFNDVFVLELVRCSWSYKKTQTLASKDFFLAQT